MITVSLLYPAEPGATFDYDYYERVHLPLVARLWADTGFGGSEAMHGVSGADGGPPTYLAVALLRFDSLESFTAAVQSEAGAQVLGDVPNYTNVQPIVQVNQPLWDTRG